MTNPEIYNESLGININLLWGLVLLTSGGFLIAKGFVKKWKKKGEDKKF